jgi:hypothetical protein
VLYGWDHQHQQMRQAEPEYLTLSHADNGSSQTFVKQLPQMHPNPVDCFPATSLVHFPVDEIDSVEYGVKVFDVFHRGEWQ